jgi:hypothetical protein
MAVKTLEERVQRLEDFVEIQNLMGRYVRYLKMDVLEKFYAQKTPGVKAEVANYGVWDGLEGVKKMFPTYESKRPPGSMEHHLLTTPVIEIAGDGKTAKGVWTSPGEETKTDKETGKIVANWCWTKYGCDFVKEDGKWKLWHYHVYRVFMSPVNTSWVDEYEIKQEARLKLKNFKNPKNPDKPPTYDNPYSSNYVEDNIPAPPDPYETWDEILSYIPEKP